VLLDVVSERVAVADCTASGSAAEGCCVVQVRDVAGLRERRTRRRSRRRTAVNRRPLMMQPMIRVMESLV
jgi:hypothetical protein